MCSRAGALLAAIAISISFKSEIRVVLVHSYPVTSLIRQTVSRRLAVPVSSLSLKTDLPFPLFINQLYARYPSLSVGSSSWLELMCQAILNVLCFCLAFLVWGCSCYVASSFWLKRCSSGPTRGERWRGLVIGAAEAALLAVLAFGISLPFLTLLPFEPLHLEHSVLFQLMWTVVDQTGVWWN